MRGNLPSCNCWAARIFALLALVLSDVAHGDGGGTRSSMSEGSVRNNGVLTGQNNEAETEGSVQPQNLHADEDQVGSADWWRREKAKASEKAGRRVWAWELDTPPGHPFYVNETKGKSWAESLQFPDPPSMPDVLSMEPIPRPEMPEWWVPTHCGTLNLTHKLTRHCFPADGSHHHVCCTDIPLDEEIDDDSLSASAQTLVKSIRAASHPSSYSWCTCDEVVCSELLGGTVSWDQHSLTRGRYYHDQINKGFQLAGWEWLVGGLDALQELAMHPLPEDDPETRDTSAQGRGGEAGYRQGSQEDASGSGEHGDTVYCPQARCPLGPRPPLRRRAQWQAANHDQQRRQQAVQPQDDLRHALPPEKEFESRVSSKAEIRDIVADDGKGRSSEELARAREALWGKDDL